ncbi:MAG: AraC family transcriptional regulator [Candidatus Limivivens sp.]|nr:AraC family transcriptional regulator [Candidatus Limivivens sp.]
MQIRIEKNKKEIKDHGNYEFPVNVSVESIQAYEQGMFSWHWHPEIELTCVLSGKMEYHVNESIYELKEGEGIFGNSNTLHSGFQKEGKSCYYLSITFHPRFLYGYESSGLQTKYVNFITENDNWSSMKLQKDVEWHQEIISEMKEIYELSKNEPIDYELQVHILLMKIWQKLFRWFSSLPEQTAQPQKNIQRLREMVAYLQEHYNQKVTLEDVADYVNICKSECCRFFKKYMNMTIFEYLMFLRIQNSLPLLKQGESVTRIADLVGFSSSAYYGQIFKRYMKCTPREYRTRQKDGMKEAQES